VHFFHDIVFFFITHIRQLTFVTKQTKLKKNPYPEYYCELIKAKSPNFPSKQQSLPCFPVPGSGPRLCPGGSIKRERQSKGGGISECVENQPLISFFSSPSVISQVAGGEREEN